MQHSGPVFCCLGLFCSIYTKYTNVFYFFQGRFEVLKLQNFKHLCQRHIQNLLKHLRWSSLLKAVKSLKEKFILDIWIWKQVWDNFISMPKQCWNDIVQYWKIVDSTFCKVNLPLFQCWTPTLYQCCATLKIWLWIFFHFQCQINVISTLMHNAKTRLIRLWNVDWIASMKKLILRNILPVTLLTNWNL